VARNASKCNGNVTDSTPTRDWKRYVKVVYCQVVLGTAHWRGNRKCRKITGSIPRINRR